MGFTGDPHTAYGSDFEEIQVPTKLGWLRRWAFPPSWCRHAAHGHSSGGAAGAQRPVGHGMADGLDFANADVTEDFAAFAGPLFLSHGRAHSIVPVETSAGGRPTTCERAPTTSSLGRRTRHATKPHFWPFCATFRRVASWQ